MKKMDLKKSELKRLLILGVSSGTMLASSCFAAPNNYGNNAPQNTRQIASFADNTSTSSTQIKSTPSAAPSSTFKQGNGTQASPYRSSNPFENKIDLEKQKGKSLDMKSDAKPQSALPSSQSTSSMKKDDQLSMWSWGEESEAQAEHKSAPNQQKNGKPVNGKPVELPSEQQKVKSSLENAEMDFYHENGQFSMSDQQPPQHSPGYMMNRGNQQYSYQNSCQSESCRSYSPPQESVGNPYGNGMNQRPLSNPNNAPQQSMGNPNMGNGAMQMQPKEMDNGQLSMEPRPYYRPQHSCGNASQNYNYRGNYYDDNGYMMNQRGNQYYRGNYNTCKGPSGCGG